MKHYIWLICLNLRESIIMEFKEADQVCFDIDLCDNPDGCRYIERNDKLRVIYIQADIWNLFPRHHPTRTRRPIRSRMVSSSAEKDCWERRRRMAWDITRVSVLDSKHPRRLLRDRMSTRSALSPATSQSVVVSWRRWLSPQKWRELLSSVVITFSMYLSTDVSRRDTRMYQSTAPLVFWTSERVMLSL